MSFYLIYISKAKELMSDQESIKILSKSRECNGSQGITGMLLYVEGNFINSIEGRVTDDVEGRFIQVLEGPEPKVIALYEAIEADARHYDLMLIRKGELEKRNFETWDMGFRSLELEEYKSLPGFFELNDSLLEKSVMQSSNFPLNFLKSFYEMSKSKL